MLPAGWVAGAAADANGAALSKQLKIPSRTANFIFIARPLLFSAAEVS
jgi:hypothetical protein